MDEIKMRLEYLRAELRSERISYGELAELQDLADHIDRSDVELLEAAGVSEFPEECRWCGQEITPAGDPADNAWVDSIGETCCESRVEGCPACDGGESHPHEPEAK